MTDNWMLLDLYLQLDLQTTVEFEPTYLGDLLVINSRFRLEMPDRRIVPEPGVVPDGNELIDLQFTVDNYKESAIIRNLRTMFDRFCLEVELTGTTIQPYYRNNSLNWYLVCHGEHVHLYQEGNRDPELLDSFEYDELEDRLKEYLCGATGAFRHARKYDELIGPLRTAFAEIPDTLRLPRTGTEADWIVAQIRHLTTAAALHPQGDAVQQLSTHFAEQL